MMLAIQINQKFNSIDIGAFVMDLYEQGITTKELGESIHRYIGTFEDEKDKVLTYGQENVEEVLAIETER